MTKRYLCRHFNTCKEVYALIKYQIQSTKSTLDTKKIESNLFHISKLIPFKEPEADDANDTEEDKCNHSV